jgi:hypothetical protein
VPLEPAHLEEAREQSGRQGAGKVRFSFGPVEAVSRQHPPRLQNGLRVDAEFVQDSQASIRQLKVARTVSAQRAAAEQRFAKRNAGPAGEVVVAATRFGQGNGGYRLAQRSDLDRGCNQAECLDGSCDKRTAKPEVAVPAAGPDTDKSAGHQTLQMAASSGGAYPGYLR